MRFLECKNLVFRFFFKILNLLVYFCIFEYKFFLFVMDFEIKLDINSLNLLI